MDVVYRGAAGMLTKDGAVADFTGGGWGSGTITFGVSQNTGSSSRAHHTASKI